MKVGFMKRIKTENSRIEHELRFSTRKGKEEELCVAVRYNNQTWPTIKLLCKP